MESLDSRDAVLELVLELLAEEEFRAGPSAGHGAAGVPARLARRRSTRCWRGPAAPGAAREQPLTVRLVKGAYWDHEIVEAAQHGWMAPVFEVKADSDRNFEALTRRLLDGRADGCGLRVAVASHNLRSIAHAIAYDRLSGGAGGDLELQVLRGLGDPLQHAIAAQGLRVRTYCPVGDLVAGMAYLVRRLLENTSNESFLADQAKGVPLERLLAPPAVTERLSGDRHEHGLVAAAVLREVERAVGGLQQRVRRRDPIGPLRDADAQRQAGGHPDRRRAQRAADAGGHALGRVRVGAAQQQRELLAADAPERVVAPLVRHQQRARRAAASDRPRGGRSCR